jgi:hypothetical protein
MYSQLWLTKPRGATPLHTAGKHKAWPVPVSSNWLIDARRNLEKAWHLLTETVESLGGARLIILLCLCCSLVKQLAALRRKVGDVADEDAQRSMCGLLMALTSSVSALKEGKHEAVLSEVLSIRLWSCCQVRSSGGIQTDASQITSCRNAMLLHTEEHVSARLLYKHESASRGQGWQQHIPKG